MEYHKNVVDDAADWYSRAPPPTLNVRWCSVIIAGGAPISTLFMDYR